MLRTIFLTYSFRVFSALGSVALIFVIARITGAEGVGLFSLGLAILMSLATISKLGNDGVLMKYIARTKYAPEHRYFLSWAFKRTLRSSVFLALMTAFVASMLSHNVPVANVILALTPAVISYALCALVAGYLKGIHKPWYASVFENGTISALCALAVGGMAIAGSIQIDALVAATIYSVSSWVLLFLGLGLVYREVAKDFGGEVASGLGQVGFDELKRVSISFFVINISTLIRTSLIVILAGALLTIDELGMWKASHQLAGVIGFVLIVLNAVFPAQFSRSFHRGDMDALGRLARQGALYGGLMSLPIVLILVLFPEQILKLFGQDFVGGGLALVIMAIGQFVSVATGSVIYLLSMTGHDTLSRKIVLITNSIGLLVFFVLTESFRLEGAATAFSLMLIGQNVVGLYFVWTRLGIWTLPFGRLNRVGAEK